MRSIRASAGDTGERLRTLWRATGRRLYMSSSQQHQVVAEFRELYDASAVECTWLGAPVATNPLDLWVYQEIVHQAQPEVILAASPNAAFLADVCRLNGAGRVVALGPGLAGHSDGAGGGGGNQFLEVVDGSTLDRPAWDRVTEMAAGKRSILVVLGLGHRPDRLAEELRRYGPLVTPGSFLIVEGTAASPGRGAAVADFIRDQGNFVADRTWEKFYLTANPGGYLRRLR